MVAMEESTEPSDPERRVLPFDLATDSRVSAIAFLWMHAALECAVLSVPERMERLFDLACRSARLRELGRNWLQQLSQMEADRWEKLVVAGLAMVGEIKDTSEGEVLLRRLGWAGSVDDFADKMYHFAESVLTAIVQGELGDVLSDTAWVDPDLSMFFVQWSNSLQGFLRLRYDDFFGYPETFSLAEYVQAQFDCDCDLDWAMEILLSVLGPSLERTLLHRRWGIPGSRMVEDEKEKGPNGSDSIMRPHNDELQEMSIGLFEGLEYAATHEVTDFIEQPQKVGPTLVRCAKNRLVDEIRKANRRLGIKVPRKASSQGESEDEVMKRVSEEIEGLRGREVLDREIETDEGDITLLERAGDSRALRDYWEEEGEAARQAFKQELAEALMDKAKLTPRQRVMAKLFDQPDEEVASSLREAFGKPVTCGAVRKLRHDTLEKLRSVRDT